MNDSKQDPEQKRDSMVNGGIERRSGLVPPKRDRIVAASTALFIARERFNAQGMQAIPNDRDARLQGQIAYDVARAEMNQAQRDLDSLTR